MAQLTLGTPVAGSDQPIGRLTALVCDPTTDEISHLVVNADDVSGSERLVPIGRLASTDGDHLTLDVSRHQFFALQTFETFRFMPADEAGDEIGWYLPFQLTDERMTFAPHERIPKSEVALRRGTRVVDRDGHRLGRVHGFVVDPASHEVTHLTLEEGHLFGHKDVTIPVTDIETITRDTIRLGTDANATASHARSRPAHH